MRERHVLFGAIVAGILVCAAGFQSTAKAQATIKVGAVQALRGVFAGPFAELNDGLMDCLAMANDEGGINGKKLEYIWETTDYEVEDSIKRLDAIVKTHHPLALYGHGTPLSLAVAPKMATEYKALYSSTSFSGELVIGKPGAAIFVSGPTYGDQIVILLKYIAKASPHASVAFFHSDSPFGNDGIKYGHSAAQRLGLRVVADETVSLKATDFNVEVARLKEKNPDYVIFHGFIFTPVPQLIKMCKAAGMKSKFMGLFWTAGKDVLDQLGPDAEGYLVVNPYSYWGMTDVPMIRKIMDYNAKRHPNVAYRQIYYMQGFTTGLIFVEVLRKADKAGQLNYHGMAKALEGITNFSTGGLTAPLTNKSNRFPVAKIWAANVNTGNFEPAPLPPGLEEWISVAE
jgi:branched-chain amino acid transport system substrate-binding protein